MKITHTYKIQTFGFRKWKKATLVNAGMLLEEYEKMNWLQKLLFNSFGKIPEQFRPKFQFYLEKNTGLKDQNGQEIWTNCQIDLRDCL